MSRLGLCEDFDAGAVAKVIEEVFGVFPGRNQRRAAGWSQRVGTGSAVAHPCAALTLLRSTPWFGSAISRRRLFRLPIFRSQILSVPDSSLAAPDNSWVVSFHTQCPYPDSGKQSLELLAGIWS